jgi:malyl-CoA/(S)-citramalyl-CoA lyase
VVETIAGGSGAAMVDGKMQDDASYKQCAAILRFAALIDARDKQRSPSE